MPTIDADYLVIGAGAMGMAFVDTLLAETDATVVLVDANHQPGGHWNAAYPFVRLHQPSAYYGVNSRALGSGSIDQSGWNAGFFELASGQEVCAYFDQVMREGFLPTGRVSYFPMSEWLGDNAFRTLGGELHHVEAARRIVDATYLTTTVPSMRPPPFAVSADVEVVAPNGLPGHARGHDHFTVVGAGKTGMDSCLWLLRNGVAPERLRWIMPRDSWLMNRANVQPGAQFAEHLAGAFVRQMQAVTEATSVDDLFARLERSGNLFRLDSEVTPTMYHCAIVSSAELERLRAIDDVVRLGHVESVDAERMVLRDGSIPARSDTLYVDCTAAGLTHAAPVPVFDGRRITLQAVRGCQQVFSSALIALLESTDHDDDARNALSVPVPHPDVPMDWLRIAMSDNRAQLSWLRDPHVARWLGGCRLDLVRGLFAQLPEDLDERRKAVESVGRALDASAEKLAALTRG